MRAGPSGADGLKARRDGWAACGRKSWTEETRAARPTCWAVRGKRKRGAGWAGLINGLTGLETGFSTGLGSFQVFFFPFLFLFQTPLKSILNSKEI